MFSPEYFMNDLSRRYRDLSGPSAELRQYCRIEGVSPESLGEAAEARQAQAEPAAADRRAGMLCADEN